MATPSQGDKPKTLVKQIMGDFGMNATTMIAEFKQLTDKDKDDLVQYYKDEGVTVTRT